MLALKKIFFIGALLFSCTVFAQIVIEEDRTVEELVRDVLVNSSCATTSNYSSFTGTSTGINGIGYFNANGSNFPFREGILLSTGRAKDAEGPNTEIISSGTEGWVADDDLRDITRTSNLFNASFIQFDFVPQASRMSFNFILASEEYLDNFQCNFADVFAFILTEPNGERRNLALIPGTNEPVSVTTVRPGVPDNCGPRNADFFAGLNPEFAASNFAGQTVRLQASAVVVPGETYTIKMVIADNGDFAFDSGVFLEGGSFSIDVDLGEDQTVLNGNPVCIGEDTILDATEVGARSYTWFVNDQEMPQYRDMPLISVNQSGDYRVEVAFSDICISNGEITLEYVAPPVVANEPEDLVACDFDGDGQEIFQLSSNISIVLGAQEERIYKVDFFESMEDLNANENAIENDDAFGFSGTSKTIYMRIQANETCFVSTSFTIGTMSVQGDFELPESFMLCIGENGLPNGDLPSIDTQLSENDYFFEWYIGAIAPDNRIMGEDGPSLAADRVGTYFVTITDRTIGCRLDLSTTVEGIFPPVVFEVDFSSEFFVEDNAITIRVEGESIYEFSIDDEPFGSTTHFTGLAPGMHTAFVRDVQQCTTLSQTFTVVDFPRFFTPNEDGINDRWNILGLEEIENPEIVIFDRYGQLLHQVSGEQGWDGTVRGRRMPESDYWFKISYLQEGMPREFKSHFSLKR